MNKLKNVFKNISFKNIKTKITWKTKSQGKTILNIEQKGKVTYLSMKWLVLATGGFTFASWYYGIKKTPEKKYKANFLNI